ncbi:MAG: Uma2 family endonuclease [Saprospiraceae bacterium]
MTAVASLSEMLHERLENEAFVRVPAAWEEYLDLLEEPALRVEYLDHEIFCTMSYASHKHEIIVGNLIARLHSHFTRKGCGVLGSNRPTYIPSCGRSFQPDVTVVCGLPELYPLRGEMNAYLNPAVVVEVLSRTTAEVDWAEKLPCYKDVLSLRHILFVESNRPYATLFSRNNDGNTWLNADFRTPDDTIRLDDLALPMHDIYENA